MEFFDKLPQICNEDTKEISKTMINSGIPECFSNKFVIKKLKEVLSKIRPELEFHKRKIQKYIFDLEIVERAHSLYES